MQPSSLNEISTAIYDILCDFDPFASASDEDTPLDKLDLDSADRIELIMCVEDKYNLFIADEVANEFETIGDIVDYIRTALDTEHPQRKVAQHDR